MLNKARCFGEFGGEFGDTMLNWNLGTRIASYYHDPFGQRLLKDVGGQRTYFLYAEEGMIAEFDGGGTPIRQYGYWPDWGWGTAPLYLYAGGEYYHYLNDYLGTPQKLISKIGVIV